MERRNSECGGGAMLTKVEDDGIVKWTMDKLSQRDLVELKYLAGRAIRISVSRENLMYLWLG